MNLQETELIDYDELEKSAIKFKPKLIIAGYSAYSRLLDFARFREIADKVNIFLNITLEIGVKLNVIDAKTILFQCR